MSSRRPRWFGRHRIGWGWGPVTWQGWVTVIVAAIAIIFIAKFLAGNAAF